ncbi:MAG: AAA family ATPase [Candidatus Peribacteraceae bacterium]|nr:AAA family ATPase [Candidatus Peribacteraceae bacterium]MDD5074656.1 AAA family ATPase [Candidatus Peribacteraceae bacterium]
MSSSLSVIGTRTCVAVTLRRIFLSPFSFLVYLLLFGLLIYVGEDTNHMIGTSVLIAVATSALMILHSFILQRLSNDAHIAATAGSPEELLPYSLVHELSDFTGITTVQLLEAAMKTKRGSFVLREMGVKRDIVMQSLHDEAMAIDAAAFVREAAGLVAQYKECIVSSPMIIELLMEKCAASRELLNSLDLSLEELKTILQWERFHHAIPKKHSPVSPHVLIRMFGGMEKSWVQGYTGELDRLTRDITSSILWKDDRVVILHGKEIDETLRILERPTRHNILVVGATGIGKTTFVENALYRLRRSEVKGAAATTRVLQLRTQELLSGSARPDVFLLEAIHQAERTGRFVLIVENMALLLKSADPKVHSVLKRLLDEKNICVIATAASEDYHQTIKRDAALDGLFEEIQLKDPTDEEIIAVMMEYSFSLRHTAHVTVTYKAMKSVLELARRYLNKGAFPGKAVEVMVDAVIGVRKARMSTVVESHVREVISQKSHMDVSVVSDEEKEKLLHLEEAIQKHIVGQDAAVGVIVSALKRARMDVGAGKRPLGTFLFLGPTGVGKTQTAKELAVQYFGSADRFIRLDMNEFSTEMNVFGIIGSPDLAGDSAEGFLTKRIQDQPFSLILLDEIEKAHKSVLNLFLQVLDEGQLIDNRGVKTDFRNSIIIATSNAGALFLRDYVATHQTVDQAACKQLIVDEILKQKIFAPEFINRFDEVVLFAPLTIEQAERIAMNMMGGIVEELNEKRGIKLQIEESLVRELVKQGYSREFGARALRRTITQCIENHLAHYMLTHEVKRGDSIVIGSQGAVNGTQA